MYKFISQVNAPYDSVVFNKHRLDGFSVEFEGMDDADALMTKLKRAGFRFKVDMRENLDLSATGDTTTSNASQEDIVEKNINEVAPIAIAAIVARILGTTIAKNAGSAVKKALSTTPKVAKPVAVATTATAGAPTTTLPESIENNEVDTTEGFDMGNIRPRDSMGKRLPFDKYPKPKVPIIKVPSIPVPTMNYVGSKTEASFSKGQMDALVKGFGPLGGSERNKIKMDKVADILKKLPKDALMQLSKANLPMVSKVAKAMTEGGPGSGPQVDVKQKKKDKADTQRLLDRQKRLQSIGKRNR